jgi:hypothetical protein
MIRQLNGSSWYTDDKLHLLMKECQFLIIKRTCGMGYILVQPSLKTQYAPLSLWSSYIVQWTPINLFLASLNLPLSKTSTVRPVPYTSSGRPLPKTTQLINKVVCGDYFHVFIAMRLCFELG